jgi:hypothetical protein
MPLPEHVFIYNMSLHRHSHLESAVKCRVCGLLYHMPRVRCIEDKEQSCFLRHKPLEAEEYAERKQACLRPQTLVA